MNTVEKNLAFRMGALEFENIKMATSLEMAEKQLQEAYEFIETCQLAREDGESLKTPYGFEQWLRQKSKQELEK